MLQASMLLPTYFCPLLSDLYSLLKHCGESRLLKDELSTDAANQVLGMLGTGVFCANSIKVIVTQLH